MSDNLITLTVFYEDPFWVGVFERTDGKKLYATKHTFGAEPKDFDVYTYVLDVYRTLSFGVPVEALPQKEINNPKRMKRIVQKATEKTGTGTKAQQAVRLQQEMRKTEQKAQTRIQNREEEERKFLLKQQKKKKKHLGR